MRQGGVNAAGSLLPDLLDLNTTRRPDLGWQHQRLRIPTPEGNKLVRQSCWSILPSATVLLRLTSCT